MAKAAAPKKSAAKPAAAKASRGQGHGQGRRRRRPPRSRRLRPRRRRPAKKAPAKKAAPAKKVAPAKKAAPGEEGSGQEGGPRQEGGPVKKAAPAKKAAPGEEGRRHQGRTGQEGAPQDDHRHLPAVGLRGEAREAGPLPEDHGAPAGQPARGAGPPRHQADDLQAEADQLAAEREGGDTQFDEESGEGDTINIERERDLLLSASAQQIVDEIDRALERIAGGTYGVCLPAGRRITLERLEALPYAETCVDCKARAERRR